jgi:hypothetical protein
MTRLEFVHWEFSFWHEWQKGKEKGIWNLKSQEFLRGWFIEIGGEEQAQQLVTGKEGSTASKDICIVAWERRSWKCVNMVV